LRGPLAAIALALLLVGLALAAVGIAPLAVFAALLEGAAGSWLAVTDSLTKAMPLVFTGLAVSVAFTGALWNIGADGQLLVGAMAACALGLHLPGWPHLLAVTALLLAGALAGALWSGLCGMLKTRYRVNEVISTIMLNYVAIQAVSWAVHGPLMEPSRALPVSAPIAPAAQLDLYFAPSQLNFGLVLALLMAVGCEIWLYRTEAGFKLRAVGKNARAAAFYGLGVNRVTLATMALSGALAGLGGAVQISAISGRLYENFSPGWGYEAIAVALVARLNPLAVVLTAGFFGALDNGSQSIQRVLGISPVLVQVIQAVVIFLLLAFDTPVLRRAPSSAQASQTSSAEPAVNA